MRDAAAYVHGPLPGGEAEACPRRFWQAMEPFHPAAKVAGQAIRVYLNEARWIAECPDCASAQLASRADPRFMCVECANIANGGAWRPLLWPKNQASIEAALDQRAPVNQNWLPGETVKDLIAENIANGLRA